MKNPLACVLQSQFQTPLVVPSVTKVLWIILLKKVLSSTTLPYSLGQTLPISAALDQLFDKDDQIASQEEDSFLTVYKKK